MHRQMPPARSPFSPRAALWHARIVECGVRRGPRRSCRMPSPDRSGRAGRPQPPGPVSFPTSVSHPRPPGEEISHPCRRAARRTAAALLGPRLPAGVVRSRRQAPPDDIDADAEGKKNGDGCHQQPSPEHPERKRFVRTHADLCASCRGRGPRGAPSPASAASAADHHSWITVRIRIATSGKGRNASSQRSFVSKRRCM